MLRKYQFHETYRKYFAISKLQNGYYENWLLESSGEKIL